MFTQFHAKKGIYLLQVPIALEAHGDMSKISELGQFFFLNVYI